MTYINRYRKEGMKIFIHKKI